MSQSMIEAGIRVMEHYIAVELKKMRAIAEQTKPPTNILSSR